MSRRQSDLPIISGGIFGGKELSGEILFNDLNEIIYINSGRPVRQMGIDAAAVPAKFSVGAIRNPTR